VIKAVVFDVDNTLVDFRKWKNAAVDAAIVAMIDAGLDLTKEQAHKRYTRSTTKGDRVPGRVRRLPARSSLGYVDYRVAGRGYRRLPPRPRRERWSPIRTSTWRY